MKTKSDNSLVSAMCQAIIEDAQNILDSMPDDCCLPTWWTSKLAVSSAYLNSLRDYITYNSDELEESDEGESEDEESEGEDSEMEDTQEEMQDMIDAAEDMLPPSARMMKNAAKEG